jgi:hypothetical protein
MNRLKSDTLKSASLKSLEAILALFTPRDRAAAILGDLTELSATRSRLWFYAAYTRTLISLAWRTPAAFLIAFLSLRILFTIVLPGLGAHRLPHLRDAGLFGQYDRHLRFITWNISFVVTQCLWFVLCFVALRFGLRNRLAQLAGVLLLLALPVYTLRPWLMDLSGILTAAAIAAAFLLPPWRRSMAVLAATCITTVATAAACFYIVIRIHHHSAALLGHPVNYVTLSPAENKACEIIGLTIAVLVLSRLHRLLLPQPPTLASTA